MYREIDKRNWETISEEVIYTINADKGKRRRALLQTERARRGGKEGEESDRGETGRQEHPTWRQRRRKKEKETHGED